MSNKVIKKYVYCIQVSLESPLCISSGDGDLTDSDVVVNGQGIPFIPGSSLAGAMRAYLLKKKSEDCIFGYEKMPDTTKDTKQDATKDASGKMSSMFVSDLLFDGKVKTTIRDGVKLSSEKTAISGEKYNMEVIDTGAKGSYCLELVIREKDNEDVCIEQINKVFTGLKNGDIRLGSKKTRGYGEVKVLSIKEKVFTKDNALEYKDAYKLFEDEKGYKSIENDNSWNEKDDSYENASSTYINIQVPLKLEGGISIRQYQAKKGEPDFVHITANGEPVIPGTSFAGAIRHRLTEILHDINATNTNSILENMFGYVKEKEDVKISDIKIKEKEDAKISDITIGECVIENSIKMNLTRNSISRFESGAKKGALFSEMCYVGGTTVLDIRVKKSEHDKQIVGLLLLALKDVQNGFLAVGGQTSIGRGLFSATDEITISEDIKEEECLKEAFQAIERG